MKHIENSNNYTAEEGCFIIRKKDHFIMGEGICLGSEDSIDNYEDEPYTDESYEAFYKSIGLNPPKSHKVEHKEESSSHEVSTGVEAPTDTPSETPVTE